MEQMDHLIQAIIDEDVESVTELLKKGANPNGFEDKDRITPLHFVAQKNSDASLQMARALLSAGANPLARNEPDAQTPIDVARLMSSPEMVDMLISATQQRLH
jgi:ankyrin repeat protein